MLCQPKHRSSTPGVLAPSRRECETLIRWHQLQPLHGVCAKACSSSLEEQTWFARLHTTFAIAALSDLHASFIS